MSAGVGILGGMFDPVHHGHLRMAVEVREALKLSEVRLLPAGNPVHRPATQAGARDRLAMLQAAVAGRAGLVVDARECEREGPSYTIDSLASLRAELGAEPLVLLLGADAFNGLAAWHRWRELLDFAHLAVMTRPGWELQPAAPVQSLWQQRLCEDRTALRGQAAGLIFHCKLTPLMISSSDLRERAGRRATLDFLVPDAVAEYIQAHDLYQ